MTQGQIVDDNDVCVQANVNKATCMLMLRQYYMGQNVNLRLIFWYPCKCAKFQMFGDDPEK